MKALVFFETKDGAPAPQGLELITAAKAIGAEAVPVTVTLSQDFPAEDQVVEALAQKAEEGFDVVLLTATSLGKLAAPRLAARLKAGSVNDAIGLECAGGKLVALRPAYGGTVHERVEIETAKAVISVRGGSFEAAGAEICCMEAAESGGAACCAADCGSGTEKCCVEILSVADADTCLKTRVREVIAEAGEAVNLEDAKVIVSGGRGMGSLESFRLCEELAGILGGVVGATRPAIEAGWAGRTHQVGQSGKIVAPDLYIACGVSGATQHVSGMTGSKYIIAINTDADAPIFSVADVGIVGDVNQILPLMIEEFRKR